MPLSAEKHMSIHTPITTRALVLSSLELDIAGGGERPHHGGGCTTVRQPQAPLCPRWEMAKCSEARGGRAVLLYTKCMV